MDSAKIFALGLAAGLAIHVVVRKSTNRSIKHQTNTNTAAQQQSIPNKSTKKNKNKKNKVKDPPPSSLPPEPAPEPTPVPASTSATVAVGNGETQASVTSSKKSKKKQQQQQQSQPLSQHLAPTVHSKDAEQAHSSNTSNNAGLAELNNQTIRARSEAAQTALNASLGDMRDAEVDPLPSDYSSVARIPAPAPEIEKPKPKLSKQELDEGWSSVGGTFPSSSSSFANTAAKLNATSPSTTAGGKKFTIASNNPFAALPNDATTSSVRRIPTSTSTSTSNANGGWTNVSSKTKPVSPHSNGVNGVPETKKQRSNANKTQAKKAAKEQADRIQAERLANHRRQQAIELAKQTKLSRSTPHSVHTSTKVPSAKASVDLNGRLVWD